MAFAHQYTHAGTAAAALQGSQMMLSTKSSHSPTSPSNIEQTRALIHESGLPLLHFLPRMPGLPDVYGQGALTPNSLGVEPSAFYPMGCPPGHLPGSPEQWKGLPGQQPVVYPFDPMMAMHPYASFYGGLDLNNAARRKNATRETTSALKAWLYEHRKNPYPTKGEKIMLAIITKMTLTQVSTWFANARRRLKKESKSGWNGKDRDLDDSDFETDGEDRSNHTQDKTNYAPLKSGTESDDEDIDIKVTSDISDISDNEFDQSEEDKTGTGSRLSMTPESSAYSIASHCFERNHVSSVVKKEHSDVRISSPEKSEHSSDGVSSNVQTEQSNVNEVRRNSVVVSPNAKPKIWSIEEIMNKDTTSKSKVTTNSHSSHNFREFDENRFRHQTGKISNSVEHITSTIQSGSTSNKTVLKTRTETIVSPVDNQNNS